MRIFASIGCGLVAVALATSTSFAGSVDIGGGWQASWDASLDGLVDIQSNGVVGDNVFIQKSAEFTQGPNQFGLFPTIAIAFTQTDPNAVSNIVIQDEIITNSTGHDWTDFHMDVLDGGDVVFDVAATAASGGPGPIGFSISPFTIAAFSEGDTRLDIEGGVVPNGAIWFPGGGVSDGDLFMATIPGAGTAQDPFTTFILKETPTPEPATFALLGLGVLALARRRR